MESVELSIPSVYIPFRITNPNVNLKKMNVDVLDNEIMFNGGLEEYVPDKHDVHRLSHQ